MRWENCSRGCLRPLALGTLLLITLLGTGCMSLGPIRSQVLDAQTGQPVPGAIALGVWTRREGPPGLRATTLAGYKEVEVDAQGRFVLEPPEGLSFSEESVTVYKPGYIAWNNLDVFPTLEPRKETRVPTQILLERFPPGERHTKHISFISTQTLGVGLSGRAPKFYGAARSEELIRD
jgi:hypothetical protein